MKQKTKCSFCSDTIKGDTHYIKRLYGKYKNKEEYYIHYPIDEGCELLLRERGLYDVIFQR